MTFTCYGCLAPTEKLYQVNDDLRCYECTQLLFEYLILEPDRGLNAVKGFIKVIPLEQAQREAQHG